MRKLHFKLKPQKKEERRKCKNIDIHFKYLQMIGISFHVGSGCMDAPIYGKAIKIARKLFDFAENFGYEFKLLDIGGERKTKQNKMKTKMC